MKRDEDESLTILRPELRALLAGRGLRQVGAWALDISQTMRQGLVILNPQGVVLEFNDFMRERYGWTDAERGRNVFADRPLLVEQGLLERFQRLIETGEPQEFLAVRNIHDGQPIYQNFRGYPLQVNGRVVAAIIQIEDVTAAVAKTQRQIESLNRLFEASRVLTSTLDLPRVLELVIEAAAQAIPTAERGAVVLLDRERGELYVGAAWGYRSPQIQQFRFPRNQGYAGWVFQHRQPLLVEDVARDPRAQLTTDLAEPLEIRSAIAAPLIARDEPIGVLDLASISRTAAFTEEDLQLLAAFANQSAVAIENARLFKETQRRIAELGTLAQIGRSISAALDLDQLLELVYQQVSLVMDTTNFFIALYEEGTDTVRFPLAIEGGVHVEERPDFRPRRAGRGLTEHVIQTRAPLLLRTELPTQDLDIELIGPQARSWLGVPLLIGTRVLGVIAVQSYEQEGAYDTGHLILLNAIASQAAIAIENARLYAQARRAEELAALNRISTLVTSSLNPQQVLDTVVAATVQVMHCQKAAIFIHDEQAGVIRLMSAQGLSQHFVGQSQHILLADERALAIREGRVLAIEDVLTLSDTSSIRRLGHEEGFRAVLDVPLRGRGHVLGVLTAYYSNPHKFSRTEIEVLTTFANQAAVAIENARLYASTDERLRERVAELSTLQQVSLRLTASLDLPKVLDIVAEAASRLVNASDIHIYLYDDQSDTFTFGAGLWGTGSGSERSINAPRKNGITALAVSQGRPVVINDAQQHPLFATPEFQTWGMKAIASFPLKRADRVVGVFNVAFMYLHEFTEDELRVLSLLADQAAIAIENARLYQEAQRLSITDGLTGLYNSRHFYAVLKKEMARADRYDRPLSLVMMDIDNFKSYNDTHGHLAGDDLLQELARVLRAEIRESDLAFRYGGEEFALLLPETERQAAGLMAERIRAILAARQFTVKETGRSGHVTVSMGVAMYPADAHDERGFVYAADTALYAAKAAGKNRVCLYHPTLGMPGATHVVT